jgi:hypothetical protein
MRPKPVWGLPILAVFLLDMLASVLLAGTKKSNAEAGRTTAFGILRESGLLFRVRVENARRAVTMTRALPLPRQGLSALGITILELEIRRLIPICIDASIDWQENIFFFVRGNWDVSARQA